MTLEEIDKMPAGRELDALIAKHVFGFKPYKSRNPFDITDRTEYMMVEMGSSKGLTDVEELKEYSTNLSDAWLVVEKLLSSGWEISLMKKPRVCHGNWHVTFSSLDQKINEQVGDCFSDAASVSLTICRSALKTHFKS